MSQLYFPEKSHTNIHFNLAFNKEDFNENRSVNLAQLLRFKILIFRLPAK